MSLFSGLKIDSVWNISFTVRLAYILIIFKNLMPLKCHIWAVVYDIKSTGRSEIIIYPIIYIFGLGLFTDFHIFVTKLNYTKNSKVHIHIFLLRYLTYRPIYICYKVHRKFENHYIKYMEVRGNTEPIWWIYSSSATIVHFIIWKRFLFNFVRIFPKFTKVFIIKSDKSTEVHIFGFWWFKKW